MSSSGLTHTQIHAINNIAPGIAAKYAYSFRGYVDRDDVESELFAWVVAHPRKLDEWVANVSGSSISDRAIVKTLTNVAKAYCMKEKGAKEGFSADDQYYFSNRDDLKIVLEAALARPSGDGPWIEALIDCREAYDSLPQNHRELLANVHMTTMTQRDLAFQMGVARSTVAKRYDAALRALHDLLSGHKPHECDPTCECQPQEYVGDRRVISNATAMAISQHNYEEN